MNDRIKKAVAAKFRHWARRLDPPRDPMTLVDGETGPDDIAMVYIFRGVDREQPFDISARDPYSGEIICELPNE